MKVSELDNARIVDAEGRVLGRLHEIHAVNGVLTELTYGPAGLFERLTGKAKPVTIPWSHIDKLTAKAIVLK